jgi:hypothetical protein
LFSYYAINKFDIYTFSGDCRDCSRLCIFFSILAAILIATAIAAALVFVLSKPNTTTRKLDHLLFDKEDKLVFASFQ